jgi:hypothetical protein
MSEAPLSADSQKKVNVRLSVFTKTGLALGLLLLAHAVFGAYCTPSGKILSGWMIGARVSQPILLATWAAFRRKRFYYRLLWALLICTYLSFADDLGMSQQLSVSSPGELIVANLAIFTALLPILMLVRRFTRWEIRCPGDIEDETGYLAGHYGIQHLIILTAIVALACGLVRSLLIITNSGFPFPSIDRFLVTLALTFVVALPTCVVPLIALGDRRKAYRRLPAILVVAVVVDSAAVVLMLAAFSQPSRFLDVVVPLITLQVGAIISAIVSTLVLRYCGFRVTKLNEVGDATKH